MPSKALLSAARSAHAMRAAARFGIEAVEPRVDFAAVHAHVRGVIAAIAPHDSVERFEGLGMQVIQAEARFVAPRVLVAGGQRIRARRVIIATGSRPATPPIDGLGDVPYFTNETIFDNTALPEHLLIVGGGPIGLEMAQAHRRLGARVTVLEHSLALPHDDAEQVRELLKMLAAEGVTIRQNVEVKRLRRSAAGIIASVEEGGQAGEVEASHLLVAAGRQPQLEALDLGQADVHHDDEGIVVDDKLRTSARGVFAIGDAVARAPHFTHVADYHAGIAVQNALLLPYAKTDYASLPWVTYSDPELAHVGLDEEQARRQHGGDVQVIRMPMSGNDRAQTERTTAGAIKLIARRNGRVLGVSILDTDAGELAGLWVLAIRSGLKLGKIARMIAPYPTLGEVSKAVAGEFYKARLFGPLSRRVVRLFSFLP
ncbi:FAD-dependent oxidoreductase [Methylibium sp.]|uniref:dihydrolipoyl dehydrogenase family protein n=1 Tax=Methylibium sp. TaxID=2067992 RepID=UPI0025EC04D3|nr:FAD-dependent oxidoreductase [Methylibium sp.]